MEEAWTPVPLDEVKAHARYVQEMAELVEAGLWEAVRYEHDGFNISFRITPAGIRQLEAEGRGRAET